MLVAVNHINMFEPIKYENLKDAYKVEAKSPSLFSYLLNNNEFNPHRLFHQLSKEELIEKYKELTKKHLELLEGL